MLQTSKNDSKILSTSRLSKSVKFFCAIFLVSLMSLAASFEADAARFGGGRSFGGSKSFSSPAPSRPATPPSRGMDQAKPGTNQAAGAATAAPGRFGGMGGMLGGLLAGGLIGSMLFGGGFQGSGIMDMLIIGALVFFGFKMYRSYMARKQEASYQGAGGGNPQAFNTSPPPSQHSSQHPSMKNGASEYVASQWEKLKSNTTNQGATQGSAQGSGQGNSSSPNNAAFGASGISYPTDFNHEEFLEGSKAAYVKIQEAWDARDSASIVHMCTPEMMLAVRQQLMDSPTPEKTEIMRINAEIVSFEQDASTENVGVYFAVLMQESDAKESKTVHELWTFTRRNGGNWLLNGLQQQEV